MFLLCENLFCKASAYEADTCTGGIRQLNKEFYKRPHLMLFLRGCYSILNLIDKDQPNMVRHT